MPFLCPTSTMTHINMMYAINRKPCVAKEYAMNEFSVNTKESLRGRRKPQAGRLKCQRTVQKVCSTQKRISTHKNCFA